METGAEEAAFAFLDFFFSMDNSLYLLLKFVLTNQGCIVVVRLVGAHLGTDDFRLNEVLGNFLQRLTIFLVHAEKQISCRFVKLKRILDFTRVRSRGTEI